MSIQKLIKSLASRSFLPEQTDIESYIEDIVIEGDEFITSFEAHCPSEDSLHMHDAWIQSEAGQQTLLNLTEKVITIIDGYPKDSVPSHDRRHIFKDLAASFHILDEEKFGQDWRSLLLFPSLLHDSGRLVEEVFRGIEHAGKADHAKTHAYLSFKMFQEMLNDYPEIPSDLQKEMLYAVVTHQSGRTHNRTMAWSVQRADREQLTGGELFNRIMSGDVGIAGTRLVTEFNPASIPSFAESSFLPRTTLYAHRLYENLGAKGEDRASRFKAMSIACIQMASVGNGANLNPSTPIKSWSQDPFIHWTETGWKREGLEQIIVPQVRQHLNKASALLGYTPQENIEDFMISSLEHPVSHLPDDVKKRLKKLMHEVSPEGQKSYARALLLMQNFRETLDHEDHAILQQVAADSRSLPFVKLLSVACQKRMGQVTAPIILKDLKIA